MVVSLFSFESFDSLFVFFQLQEIYYPNLIKNHSRLPTDRFEAAINDAVGIGRTGHVVTLVMTCDICYYSGMFLLAVITGITDEIYTLAIV